ncbi:hypothetical protein D3C72_1815380 [compost metagenome]
MRHQLADLRLQGVQVVAGLVLDEHGGGRRRGGLAHAAALGQHHVDAGGQHAIHLRQRVGQLLRQRIDVAGALFQRRGHQAFLAEDLPHAVEPFPGQAARAQDIQRAGHLLAFHRHRHPRLGRGLLRRDARVQQHRQHLVGLAFVGGGKQLDARSAGRQHQQQAQQQIAQTAQQRLTLAARRRAGRRA